MSDNFIVMLNVVMMNVVMLNVVMVNVVMLNVVSVVMLTVVAPIIQLKSFSNCPKFYFQSTKCLSWSSAQWKIPRPTYCGVGGSNPPRRDSSNVAA